MSRKYLEFKEVSGKAVEHVALCSAHGFHAVAIRFKDATILHIDLQPGLTARADYTDWKSGHMKTIRKWPEVRGEGKILDLRSEAIRIALHRFPLKFNFPHPQFGPPETLYAINSSGR